MRGHYPLRTEHSVLSTSVQINPHIVVILLGLLLGWGSLPGVTKAAEQPNILLIVSDDQGWPDLGCIGTKPIKTPNLDKLAASGVRLTNYYVTWPACTPSRGSILTGRHPLRNGLYDMIRNDMVNYGHRYSEREYAISPEMTLGLDVRERTLGDMLRSAGYRSGMVGKWDMGQARRFLPLQRGFDFFYGFGNNGIDYYTHERYGIHSIFAGNTRTRSDQGTYSTDLFEGEALRFIRESGEQPWFLYLCFNAPHGASSFGSDQDNPQLRAGVQAPKEYLTIYEGSVPEKLRPYYAAVTCMDAAIGRIIDEIGGREELDNTLVIFQSDNGGSGNGGNAPLRGGKSTLWEGGLRVPCVVSWPAKIPAAQVSDEFLTTLELLPTLAAAAGAQPPKDTILDGYNLLPVVADRQPSPRKEMFWEFRGQKAARVGNYKWIESDKVNGLYDLAADTGEQHDLTAAKPDVAADLRDRWTKWRAAMEQAEPHGPFRDY